MAPLLVNVKNSSSKPRDLYTSKGTKFPISNGAQVIVNHHLDGTTDTKIQINSTDVRSYLLKYVKTDKIINILINDTLGRTNKVADTLVWVKNEEEDVDIEICEDTIKISTSEKNLRLYKSDGKLSDRYYKTVIARNNDSGGITITGVDDNEAALRMGDEDEDEDEVEGEPSKTN